MLGNSSTPSGFLDSATASVCDSSGRVSSATGAQTTTPSQTTTRQGNHNVYYDLRQSISKIRNA